MYMLYNCEQTNDHRKIFKSAIAEMQWNIENIVMIAIKPLQRYYILTLNNP